MGGCTVAGMLQEDDLSVEMNPTKRPADSYPTTKIMQQGLCNRGIEGESQGIPQVPPPPPPPLQQLFQWLFHGVQ